MIDEASTESDATAPRRLGALTRRAPRAQAFADQEQQRVAAIVGNILTVLLVAIGITLLVQFAISGLASGMIGLVASALWVLALMYLLRRGYVQLTALLLILNVLLLVNVSSIGFGGIRSPTMAANLLVILMAILLVTPWRVLLVAILTIGCIVGVYCIDVSGLGERLPFPQTPNTPEMALMTHLAHLLGAAYFLSLAVNGLQRALERARREEARVNQLLDEARVARSVAEEANLAKLQFMANMSHELRTPLNAVIGFSEMLIEDADELTLRDATTELMKIRNAGAHLLGIISDILDFTKIESGRLMLERSEFPLSALADELVAAASPLARRNRNTLELTIDPTLQEAQGFITGDRLRLYQILFNLLSNAAKFTEDGQIAFSVARGDDASEGRRVIVFTVRDTGIGIPAEKLPRLFESFYQVDSSFTRKHGGTGLGLGISRALADMMGARLRVTSTPGEGSEFTLHLPVDPPPVSSPSHSWRAIVDGDL